MSIYKPSELRKYLNKLGIRPKKRLSQNFLLDGNIIGKIVNLAHLSSNDVVMEIGPGPGALTEMLLKTGAKVLAVEKDHALAAGLERLSSQSSNLMIYCEDILAFAVEKEVAHHLASAQRAKVVANLPYHLTTPIVSHLIPMHHLFSHLVVMVQEEVARGFVAQPRTKGYSSLSVFLRYYSIPRYAFKVKKNCFYPKPKVESAVVEFTLKDPPQVSDEKKFFEMTRTAFGHRRKMLRTSLRKLYDSQHIHAALEELAKSPKARPEELSLEDFLKFFEKLLTKQVKSKLS